MNKKLMIVCLALLSIFLLSGCQALRELYGIPPLCVGNPNDKDCICDEYREVDNFTLEVYNSLLELGEDVELIDTCVEAHRGSEEELFERDNPNCIGYGYDSDGDYVCVNRLKYVSTN